MKQYFQLLQLHIHKINQFTAKGHDIMTFHYINMSVMMSCKLNNSQRFKLLQEGCCIHIYYY